MHSLSSEVMYIMPNEKNNLFRKSTLDRISSPEKLNSYVKITSLNLTLIIISVFSILFAGFMWIFTSSIPKYEEIPGIIVESYNGEKKLYSFVDIGTSKKLSVGMSARISPNYFPVEKYGYINGEITKIGNDLIDDAYITSNFKNYNLFASMFPNYFNCVEVVTSLKEPSQDKININDVVDGSQCTSSVVIGNQRAIDLVLNK